MEELYKDPQSLPLDVAGSPPALGGSKLENGVAQLITAEAWNINSADLMKKALSPLVSGPAPPMLPPPPAEAPGGVALKVAAAAVLQPICLGDSPVVLPIHLQVAGGSAAPQLGPPGATPYVMTTQGPVPLPVLLEQHVFQHLNSPLVLPQGGPCAASPLAGGQAPLLDQKPPGPAAPEPGGLPPAFQGPAFAAVLQDLFPAPGSLGAAPPDYGAPAPPQPFASPLSPLVPPATLLVPYPVIVPLPVPVPVPVPVPIPVPHCGGGGGGGGGGEPKLSPDFPGPPASFGPYSCKGTQTPLEKEELKPFALLPRRELAQLSRHTVIKMSPENEALDLSVKSGTPAAVQSRGAAPEDGALDLSLASCRKAGGRPGGGPAPPKPPPEAPGRADGGPDLPWHRPKWPGDPAGEPKAGCDPDGGNTSSQAAKVIVSVKDAVPAVFCGKVKGLSGVSTKNFSFKRDLPPDSALPCYDVKGQAEAREAVEPLRKPMKNRSVKLKKMNSQEIHILPIKKQRLAAFFPRK
ncbi:retinoic acid-induced protein 2 [Tachyglossus aculeatus]|uniref:retinoic acid-induced protein 2 n=1 Tax=Tachyglossus aculeatus TaxID=9261 RepID=UPI0018F428A4|nr:retinoic acid-induced protein 2 [Tachyglossus aculeatus]XP_038612936.1 retinoic acid-induced protein 2 [Tachyglossus aculeatus]XP_038612937.1 retinoic acid-induced protein 2 [Tachyglossus aculeatus]XP_038612938.1 retinoic acid-induced protein 2 [Tachyglossus aculeatus]XP_038612939.1 retinoic acid-induced protein 2 [Tachyglossus aculeatus]XP_038612940.1 retinoic acid-induced protein 2 [Tachyglossus aculeatus]XP_038612941.1 retinoic acid-induced protein 2 [Tachyglossus aculeatus]XP_03861294